MRRFPLALAALLVVGLAGCSHKDAAAKAAAGPQLAATIQEIMKSEVEPGSNILWNAVAVSSDSTGVHETKPQTDEDWVKLRYAAVTLAEASNLIVMDGRHVVHPGQKVQDEGGGGLTGAQIEERVKAEHDEMLKLAKTFQDVSLKALAAVDRRDLQGITEVGGEIDEACEACHQHFWYPDHATATNTVKQK